MAGPKSGRIGQKPLGARGLREFPPGARGLTQAVHGLGPTGDRAQALVRPKSLPAILSNRVFSHREREDYEIHPCISPLRGRPRRKGLFDQNCSRQFCRTACSLIASERITKYILVFRPFGVDLAARACSIKIVPDNFVEPRILSSRRQLTQKKWPSPRSEKAIFFVLIGRSERIRTSDPYNPIVVRYQAAPRSDPLACACARKFCSRVALRRDSILFPRKKREMHFK